MTNKQFNSVKTARQKKGDSLHFVLEFGMVIRVNVPEDLAAQAQARGVALETYVEEILAQQAAAASVKVPRVRTPEQIRDWLDSLAQFSDKIPPLPETISREWIYQDHD